MKRKRRRGLTFFVVPSSGKYVPFYVIAASRLGIRSVMEE